MTRGRYLNAILTINAVLLASVVWLQLAGSHALESPAMAQTPPRDGNGIPNAGGQRERMINELEAIRASIDGLKKVVDGGKMKVVIANVDDLRAAARADSSNNK